MDAAVQTREWMAIDRTICKLYMTKSETAKEELLAELLPNILLVLKEKNRSTPIAGTLPEADEKLTITQAAEKFSLTRRERMILRELLDGKENDVICDELAISVNTLKKHILNIYRKMDIRNRVQLFKMVREKE